MKKSEEVLNKKTTLNFYKLTSETIPVDINTATPIAIQLFKPSLFKLKAHKGSILIYLFWFFFTLGKYRIYYVKDDQGNIIHFSHTLPKFFKFPFMEKDDIEIGPCWTNEKFRGKNIYPAVLLYIFKSLRNKNRNFYMMTNDSNIPSQKGIEKVGFKFYGKGLKKGCFGIYLPNEIIEI